MVDTTSPVRDVHTVAYTVSELNRLVSREIAGRYRELASTLCDNAAFLLANDDVPARVKQQRSRAYLDIAMQLHQLADGEIRGAELGQVTR
ncbi:hypothetical protein OHS58_37405 [Amycolatopsis sp. NBC_00348]|uniref:hypothetical protein n=1 Tax=Amycolatopsis sp. NBC_00348 TaxID=2975956 RepID=UPI002E2656CD